jgi:hypothetical protein
MMNATTLQAGMRLKIKLNGEIVEAVYVGVNHANADYGVFCCEGREYSRAYSRVENLNMANPVVQVTGTPAAEVDGEESAVEKPETVFNVNTRFMFIERLVDMIVRGQEKSLIITGSGGLGKSYTVFNRLKLNDLGPADYEKISGHMTPKALYRRLHEANGKIIVFDDCDSVLVNETAINLLKSALDSYGNRQINWCSEMGGREGELPNSFEFTGRIIFISNFALTDIPQPVVSRALYVDVTMTQDEKIERITAIAPSLCPDMPVPEREECLELLVRLRYKVSDLNLRTMLKVASIRRANPLQWREMSTYMVCAKLNRSSR